MDLRRFPVDLVSFHHVKKSCFTRSGNRLLSSIHYVIGDVESVQQRRITLSVTVFFFLWAFLIYSLLSVSIGNICQDRWYWIFLGLYFFYTSVFFGVSCHFNFNLSCTFLSFKHTKQERNLIPPNDQQIVLDKVQGSPFVRCGHLVKLAREAAS